MFESLLEATDVAIGAFIFDAWARFIAIAADWITSMLVLYVAITGYLMLMGRFGSSVGDWFVRVLKLFVVTVLLVNVDLLTAFLYVLATDVPESVASVLAGVSGDNAGGINSSIGVIWQQGLTATQNIFQEASLTTWSPVLFALIVLITTVFAIVYITFLVMLAKLAVAVLLGVAPFFIVLYLFEATKPIFEGWMRQLLSFALIPIFLYGLLALVINIVHTMSDQMVEATANEVWGITHVGPYALVMLVSLLLTTQVMSWASGVAGGFSLSSVNAFGRASRLSAVATGAGAALAYRTLSKRLATRRAEPVSNTPDPLAHQLAAQRLPSGTRPTGPRPA